MAGLTSLMLCLYAFPCKQAPRQKPTSTSFIPYRDYAMMKRKKNKKWVLL